MPLREQSRIPGQPVCTICGRADCEEAPPQPASTREADGAVPPGYRLGDGWIVPTGEVWCTYHDEHLPPPPASYDKVHGGAACADCAIQAGALVSLDPPPVVPPMQPCTHGPGEHPDGCDGDVDSSPAPVPMEATRISAEAFEEWRRQPTTPAPQPAEPAKAPLSAEQLEASVAWARQWINTAGRTPSDYRAFAATVQLADKVAALEAELAEAKRHNTINAGFARDFIRERDAARAEVEQLKAQLAEADKDAKEWENAAIANETAADTRVLAVEREADARVLAMRTECAKAVRSLRANPCIFCQDNECVRCFALALAIQAIERLPTSTGTAAPSTSCQSCYGTRQVKRAGQVMECPDCKASTGPASGAGGEGGGERCNWFGCHCGGLGKKTTDFVPMDLEDISQLLAEVATFHRWGETRMQGLDRQMRRLDWEKLRLIREAWAEAPRGRVPGKGGAR